MSNWWIKAPIILGSLLMVFLFTRVASAASEPELSAVITAILDAFEMVLKQLYDILVLIW